MTEVRKAVRDTPATIGQALEGAAKRLAEAGVEEARRDARLLLAAALDVEIARVMGWPETLVELARLQSFDEMIRRRADREPVSRILGRREFWGLEFAVSPHVLDPRPETETLVEAVLDRIPDRGEAFSILDLGTGSGCILAALLSEYPKAEGLGVDLSFGAAAQARANAAALGLSERTHFSVGNWSESLAGEWKVIVSNPPYIISSHLAGLAAEVARFDPHLALAGGEDGLAAYRGLFAGLIGHLVPDGVLVVELGVGQADAVETLLREAGFTIEGRRRDLSGVTRCLLARA